MLDSATDTTRILVVDDESFFRSLIVQFLASLGYAKVESAENGSSALGRLATGQTDRIDLIILDLSMPEMDGVEFMRHVGEAGYTGGIILVSGVDRRILETSLELGKEHDLNVLGALPKPLEPDSLGEMLRKFDPQQQVESRDFKGEEPISEEELRAGIMGLDRDALQLFFQPIFSIQSGDIVAVETLARWQHETRGLLGPGAFIPLAEETGTIDDLTNQIYRKALHQALEWERCGHPLRVTVNFSAESFATAKFADFIARTTASIGVDPGMVMLEVNESQVMGVAVETLENIVGLRLKNFHLAIDDYGTGSSSPAQLQRIPFTEMKLDRSLLQGASSNDAAMSILKSSVDLAQKLGMKTIAEGIETEADWEMVLSLGCDYAQGYFCDKPMSAEKVLERIKRED